MALAAALALPALPALSATAANAAELQNVSFSNVTISEGSKPLDADGFLPAANTLTINHWNPGNVSGSSGNYVMLGFDVAVPNGAQPGDTFSVSLPEFWTVRGAASLADLVDPAGNTIATTKVVTANGIRSIQFTLTEFVKDRENLTGNLTFMAQELSSPDRPVGDYVAPVVTNTGQQLIDLKARVPAPYWAAPSLSMSWSGDPNTPAGGVELRSRPSYDGASSVKATVYAGPGYIFDCEALRNQDPTKAIGIGLVDIGPEGVRNSLPTEEWLLDPSKYTLTCDGGSFTVEMPASSWTSADAESGQVLRIITTRIPTDDSWKDDGAVFAYADLEQNGRTLELNGRAVPPGSTGSGTSNQLPPGAFETLMFQDMNGNNLFDEGTDVVLPGIQVKLTGATSTGAAVDTTVTTDDQGRARATMRAGDYTATIANPPAGMTQVTPNAGDDALDSDFDGGTATFTVTSRETTARDGGFFVPMGTFLADKAITGDAADLVPADTEFTLDYSYPAGAGYPAGSGTLVVTADGTQVESPQIPVGAVVTITEQAPAPIAGTEWGAPEYSSENVTITNGSQLAEFTVTNPISIQYGTFSAKKAVTGEAAGIVPGDTEFTLNYSYPAGPGYEAGAGSLTLTADGTPVTSPEIPVGAVVTLEEATPAPVENAEWQRPVLSADTVTIVAGGTSGEIVVTNQLDLKYGSFSAKKELTGEAAGIVPGDTEFTLNYSYPAGPGYEAGAGTLTLTADGTPVTSEPIPYGAVVTLSEATPTEIPNAVWSEPVLSTEEITISAFSSGVEITVTNELNLRYGAFSVAKQLAGDAAGLVADDTEFTVDYAFPAGPGYEAGAGSLTITADGTPTVLDGIPAGAVVTIEEQDPAAIDGLEWTGVAYSATDATIVADETAEFTVTNEATEVTTPVGPKPDGPELPTTGAAAGWAGGALAAALLAGGAILLLVRRRRIAAE